jgi:hypothetical protein
MSQFAVTKKVEGSAMVISFQGHIDEDATFAALDLNGVQSVQVDLGSVDAINSCGIREWIKWIRSAPENVRFTYQKCPKVIVDQINMVSGFLPANATVESFYVPYYSDSSGTEKMVLFQKGVHFDAGKVTPPEEVKDDSSGELMEMDVIESKYFKFLNR